MATRKFRVGSKDVSVSENEGVAYSLSKDLPTPEDVNLPDFPGVYKSQARQMGWLPTQQEPSTGLQGKVVRWPGGRVSVLTNIVTFQLREGVPVETVRETFGLSTMQPHLIGQRFFLARIPTAWGDQDHPIAVLERMRSSGLVEKAEPEIIEFFDPEILDFSPNLQADDGLPWHWGVGGLNLTTVWGDPLQQRGSGLKIGVIDMGFEELHPYLKVVKRYRISHKHDLPNESISVRSNAAWDFGENRKHGTFCAGLAASQESQAGLQGAAPEAELVLVGLDLLSQTALAKAIELCIQEGVRVISCSLNTRNLLPVAGASRADWGPLKSDLRLALEKAAAAHDGKGIAVFWATSNNDGDLVKDNAVCALDEVIAVGSFRRNRQRGKGASGRKLEFLAPGEFLSSTIPDIPHKKTFQDISNSYATPCAAGAGALILNQNPNLTVAELRRLLAGGCRSVTVPGKGPQGGSGSRTDEVGFGAIDVGAVLAPAQPVAGGVSPPAVVGGAPLQPVVPTPSHPEPNNPSP